MNYMAEINTYTGFRISIFPIPAFSDTPGPIIYTVIIYNNLYFSEQKP